MSKPVNVEILLAQLQGLRKKKAKTTVSKKVEVSKVTNEEYFLGTRRIKGNYNQNWKMTKD